ncbi:MAG TPA: tryptophan 2,3-dioxygenase family protein [Cytophagales bacterium]|nr:tryptophan 2,3-dioxygenase family protein [Cytophagales bacterium]
MDNPEKNELILDKLKKLEEKYEASGQDMASYLDGLLYADFLTYWDYIHLDTLLSLQNTKTAIPDEKIFLTYHQINELYFKLVLWEIEQIANHPQIDANIFLSKLGRINRYFEHLIESFDILVDGLFHDEFLKFRMSLLPASGFQSVQYRLIEIASTDFSNLVALESRDKITESITTEELFEILYWQSGSIDLESGKKTLTLQKFVERYKPRLLRNAKEYTSKNLLQIYNRRLADSDKKEEIINALKYYDILVNVNWPLAHYKSIVRFLQKDKKDIAATGGTNYKKYLPPRFQRRIFYPALWSEEEQENWGKSWVLKEVFNIKSEF